MFMTATMDKNVVSQYYFDKNQVLVMLSFNMMACKERITA